MWNNFVNMVMPSAAKMHCDSNIEMQQKIDSNLMFLKESILKWMKY